MRMKSSKYDVTKKPAGKRTRVFCTVIALNPDGTEDTFSWSGWADERSKFNAFMTNIHSQFGTES